MDRYLFLLIMLLYDRAIYKVMETSLFQTLLLAVTVVVMIPHFAAKALREYFTQWCSDCERNVEVPRFLGCNSSRSLDEYIF
jgi:hypothetical protein